MEQTEMENQLEEVEEEDEEEMGIDAKSILEGAKTEPSKEYVPEQEGESEDDIDTVTCEALNAARQAFYDILEEHSYDGAYWDLEIHAHQLSMDFARMVRYSIEDVET